jgi:hypothetical protein
VTDQSIDRNIGNAIAVRRQEAVVAHIFCRHANACAGLRQIAGIGENNPPIL